MNIDLTDEQILEEYEKRILVFTLKNGFRPNRRKLFNYLFSIFDIKCFNPSSIVITPNNKFEDFNRTARLDRFKLRYSHRYAIINELKKHNFQRYIGNYKLQHDPEGEWINYYFNVSNVRWDLIDYDLKKYKPHLVENNKNSFHILKQKKWIPKHIQTLKLI